jgi:Flp pilus assembly pilin Flp
MFRDTKGFRRDSVRSGRRASTHTEYVLIAAVISIAALIALAAIGGSLSDILEAIAEVLRVF